MNLNDLHDCNLCLLDFRKLDEANIGFINPDGKLIACKAHNVRRLSIQDFREGNIVLTVRILPANEISNAELLKLLGWGECEDSPAVQAEQAFIREHDLKLMIILPSYGARMHVLASDFQFESNAQILGKSGDILRN